LTIESFYDKIFDVVIYLTFNFQLSIKIAGMAEL